MYIDIKRRRLVLAACGLPLALPALPTLAQPVAPPGLDVPYEPSPPEVVDAMLKLAGVGPNDTVYDLGCGDGRIVIAAARRGAKGVGIDLDPKRIAEAKANAAKAGVAGRTRFRVGDLYASDFSDATVVTLFLWPHVNLKLKPILWQQLRPGTRVVSHIWEMGQDWPPERSETLGRRRIHLWTIRDAHKRAR
ncbi:class I SAM-dependent methyltransferase [Noviherbaspirillum aridicola]|uniref:Methyltransferase domain-containing protein n=1 Tax=Noviherbaspirillum aridicola TaxID=2849687 RepID=A0ABQ4Q7K1_9BURK|nr:methyltransferase domain-containing protein [Noviherbaspirillum aridicola]GIZ53019.1 hypothetical protein NCCP691_30330 [Noviherbaspirillum aridicola]